MRTRIVCVLTLLCFLQCVNSSKFIMLSVFGSQSHLNPFYGIGSALVQKGHEVTLVTAIPITRNVTGITQIFLEQTSDVFFKGSNMLAGMVAAMNSSNSQSSSVLSMFTHFWKVCAALMDDPEFKKIIAGGRQYDVAINNYFLNDCTIPAASILGKHVVLAGASGMPSYVAYDLNIPHPISYIPNVLLGYSVPMTFMQRAISASVGVAGYALNTYLTRSFNAVIKERYADHPTIQEVKDKVSLVLVNHLSLIDGSVPSVPYVQSIGGIHLKLPKPLPKEFETFIQGAGEAGFIFVSLGSVVPEELMPEDKKKVFVEAFSKLPYRVIWKFKEQRTDLPPNVMLTKWAPQLDLLGDPRCRAFISHGGRSSVDETTYSGVPVVGMPLFGDQFSNIKNGVHKGYMVQLLWSDLTADTMVERINEVISNPKYKQVAQGLSKIMKDQLESPVDRAVFWLEYVIRHDGAAHLRTAADHLNFFQYFLLDVLAAALLATSLVFYIVYRLIKLGVCLICGKRCKSATAKKKAKKNN